MDNMLDEAISNIEGYLNGTKKAKKASLPGMGSVQVSGKSLTSGTKPIFSVGYGHQDGSLEPDVQDMNSAISKNAADIANETAARDAADKAHAAAIEALEEADAAQDELIAKKADQEALNTTNDAVALNTAAVADHKTRIEVLEATSKDLGTTYVKVSDYNSDKEAFEQKHTDLQGEIDAAEGRLDVVEGDIATIKGEQKTQNAAIEAAAAKGQQGIDDAAAALAEAQAKVKSVSGDADVNASTTDHAVSLSLNKATTVSKDDDKAVTSSAVYDHLYGNDDIQGALCWVEFE
jgi:predicted  nucleic acid-binding Zn-ribbon protein